VSACDDDFTFDLTGRMLSVEERRDLCGHGVDGAVWTVYDRVSEVFTKTTQFRVLRAYHRGQLAGAAFMFRCRAWGQALFKPRVLYGPTDFVGLPAHIWIRVGYCAEGIANPGFVRPDCDYDTVIAGMVGYLRKNALGTIITDLSSNAALHENAARFPYVSDGRIDLEDIHSVDEYRARHNNLKRKIAWFTNKGGRIDTVEGALDGDAVHQFRSFVHATVRTSLVYSPFQDCFDGIVTRTCGTDSDRIVHFLASMNGTLTGYHTFIRTDRALRMIHGAFNRELRTTHHAYENLILETVRNALARGLHTIHFGPVLNETKRRMMRHTDRAALLFYSNNPIVRTVIPQIFPCTWMQSRQLLAFDL